MSPIKSGKTRPGIFTRIRAFTLIELLVVLAIIATLLSIVAPRYVHQTDRAKEAVLRENLSALRRSLDNYYSDTGKYPEKLSQLIERHYLRTLPLDPVTNRSDGWIPIMGTAEDDSTIVDIKSSAEGKASDGTEYRSW
ncbi:prepilin-type N-terminal cleavage/methylation domain-containing protein [Paraburkholderia azotifigens]|uniref:type II secretion system protein n=1 Tax=Paraburkholderia azotifigens TaxID=2057004 RepID=UPI00318264EA